MEKKIKNCVEIIYTVNSEYKETSEKCVRTDMGSMNYKSVVIKRIRKSDTSGESWRFSESDIGNKKDFCKTTSMRYNSKSLISSRHHKTREFF